MTDEEQVRTEYAAWLLDQMSAEVVGEWIELTLPYLDRHFDHLQVYVRPHGDGYVITDDGVTFRDAFGTSLTDDDFVSEQLGTILRGFGVTMAENEMQTAADAESLPERIHALAQVMLSVESLLDVRAASLVETPRTKAKSESGGEHG